MKGKLIKLNVGIGYRLDDEHGNLLASTLNGSKNKLSFKNCEAIESGYDLDELAEKESQLLPPNSATDLEKLHLRIGFVRGAKAILELLGDKKFSEQDMIFFAERCRDIARREGTYGNGFTNDWELCSEQKVVTTKWLFDKHQSLQQTEWQVEVLTDKIPADLAPGGWDVFPKLDAENCLILKRI